MNKINKYNPEIHNVGKMPVRVLNPAITKIFSNFSEELIEYIHDAIDIYGFIREVIYYEDERKITDAAEIDKKSQIHIHENFCAFLWTISYALVIIFDKGVLTPMREGTYKGRIERHSEPVKSAFEVLEYGLSLLEKHTTWDKNLPNPEIYLKKDEEEIKRTNSVYIAAICFVLGHEFGHHWYGHNSLEGECGRDNEDLKQDEFITDEFAFDILSSKFEGNFGNTFRLGIIAALGAIILMDDSLEGGEVHPDSDERLKCLLEKMELDDYAYEWGAAALLLNIWRSYYGESEFYKEKYTFKQMFYLAKEGLK